MTAFAVQTPFSAAPPFDTLSFITARHSGGGFDYWDVKPTGTYASDLEIGHILGDEYLSLIGKNSTVGNGTLPQCIVQSMIEHAVIGSHRLSGVEIGFLSTVNKFAMASARIYFAPDAATAA